jgi:hypothetical protein
MSLMSGKNAGICVLSSVESILKSKAHVMIQNKEGMFKKIILSFYWTAFV